MPHATLRRVVPKLSVLLACAALLLAPRAFAALTVTFSESVVDKVITARDAQGLPFFDLRTTNSGSCKAVWTIPSSTATNLTTNTPLEISLGGWSFAAALGEASLRTATSWTFIRTAYDAANGRDVETGRILLSRAGTNVTLTGTFKQLDASFAAGEYVGLAGAVQGQTFAAVRLGESYDERNIYYKGTGTATNRVFGAGASAVEFPVNTVQLTGGTDNVRPALSITTPKPGLKWSNDTVTVTGKAADNFGVGEVRVKLNDHDWLFITPASASNLWTVELPLDPGTNVIRAVSVDLEGNTSLTSVVQVLYVFPLKLASTPAAGGTVAGVANGQMFTLGVTYKATAIPRAGYLFNGWSGDYTQAAPALNFVMALDRTLQANFVPDPFPSRKGLYNGLFFPGDAFSSATNRNTTNSGFITLTLAASGAFGGKLLMEGNQFPFTGQFSPVGSIRLVVARGTNTPVTLDLGLDVASGTLTISGTVSNEFWTASLLLQLMRPTAFFKGRYTVLIVAESDPAISPGGDGALTMTVDANGVAAMTGTLGDGTPVSASAAISQYRGWPLYAPLYGGRGVLLGWMYFVYARPDWDVASQDVLWHKPPTPGDPFYPSGFTNQVTLARGFLYFPPAPGQSIVGWTNGFVFIGAGNLPTQLVHRVMMVNNEVRFVSWVATNDFTNFSALAQQLTNQADAVSAYLWGRLALRTRQLLINSGSTPTNAIALAGEWNKVLLGPSIYNASRFAGVALSAATTNLVSQNPQGAALNRLNRLLLEDAFPQNLARSPANTNNVNLAFTVSNGAYSGSFTNPVTGQLTPFKGALLQPLIFGTGNGWFLGTNQSGYVFISDRGLF